MKHTRLELSFVLKYPKTVLCVSGFAAGGMFSWLYPVILLPFLLAVPFYIFFQTKRPVSFKLVMDYTLAFIVPFHAAVFSWFLDADINSLAGISSKLSLLTSFICLCMMVAVTTASIVPTVFGLYKTQHLVAKKPVLLIFIIASFWVVAEWFRSIVFGAWLYGEQGIIGDFWNFGSLGLALMDTPLAYAGRILGMYGLSFVVIILSGGLYLLLIMKRPSLFISSALVVSLLGVTGFYVFDSAPGDVRSASVLQSEDINQGLLPTVPIENYSDTPKDIIVLPEYSYTYRGAQPDYVKKYLNNRLGRSGFSISVTEGAQKERFGTLEFRDRSANILKTHTKEFLIPTGEYLPAVFTTFYNLTGQHEVVEEFDSTRKLTKGRAPEVYRSPVIAVGPVACSGILSRNIYRDLAKSGAGVFTNSASLSTLNGSRAYFRQSLQMARFHAIANNRPYIQSTKGAAAFVLDKNGRYLVKPTPEETKFIDFEFQESMNKTVYTILGDWALVVSGAITIAFVSWSMHFKYRTAR